jgi:hypothetical protein
MQHAVVEIGSGDLHVIGEAKAPLERAACDAAVQVTVAVLLLLPANHGRGRFFTGFRARLGAPEGISRSRDQ